MKIDKESGIFIYKNEKEGRKGILDQPLADAIFKMFDGKMNDVADLGCATGKYCAYLSELGWNMFGFEGNPYILDFCEFDDIEVVDLSKPQLLGMYDGVICLEVGEHIPQERMHTFIDNVVSCCRRWLVLSWAVPGQGGTGHVNELPNLKVIEEVEKYGFKFNQEKSKQLRAAASFRWFKNTIMVFEDA